MGSSSYITDNFGRPSHYYEYLPFGELMTEHNQSKYYIDPYPTQNMDSYNNPYKFNGKEMDRETGMYYYGARYYDPRMSIFVSVDPLAEQTMEPYLYTGNNPIMFTDPTGMSKEGGEHDYRLKREGKGVFSLELIRETKDDFHRIYNEDGSDNITVSKDFIDGAKYTPRGKVYPLSGVEAQEEVANHTFEFFANNSAHEYGLNTFKDNKTGEVSGFLSTSFESGRERSGKNELYSRMDINPNLFVTRDVHSHPSGGKYSDSDYPSGYALRSWKNPGTPGIKVYDRLKDDALYYHNAKKRYGNRIPDNFEIYVPKAPTVKIFYNDEKAIRTDNGVAY